MGQRLLVGDVEFEVQKRTVRCDATRICPRAGRSDGVDPVALLKQYFPQHGPYLGIYARVVRGGRIAAGDTVFHVK